jgi:hypothetical protein
MSGGRNILNTGVDISKYSLFNYTQQPTSTDSNWVNILTLNGKGFLNCVGIYNSSSSFAIHVRVYIDDVLVHQVTTTTAANGILMLESMLRFASTNFRSIGFIGNPNSIALSNITNCKPYPCIDDSNSSVLIPQEIFFNKSLKIDVKADTTGIIMYSWVMGGVM